MSAEMGKEILLDVQHLSYHFPLTKKMEIKAVDDVSFKIRKREIFGLVGGIGMRKVHPCALHYECLQI